MHGLQNNGCLLCEQALDLGNYGHLSLIVSNKTPVIAQLLTEPNQGRNFVM